MVAKITYSSSLNSRRYFSALIVDTEVDGRHIFDASSRLICQVRVNILEILLLGHLVACFEPINWAQRMDNEVRYDVILDLHGGCNSQFELQIVSGYKCDTFWQLHFTYLHCLRATFSNIWLLNYWLDIHVVIFGGALDLRTNCVHMRYALGAVVSSIRLLHLFNGNNRLRWHLAK